MDRPPPYNPIFPQTPGYNASAASFASSPLSEHSLCFTDRDCSPPAYQPRSCEHPRPIPVPRPRRCTSFNAKSATLRPKASPRTTVCINHQDDNLVQINRRPASTSHFHSPPVAPCIGDSSSGLPAWPVPSSRRRSTGCYQSRKTNAVAGNPPNLPPRRVSAELQRSSAGGMRYHYLASRGLKMPTRLAVSMAGSVLIVDVSSMTVSIYMQNEQKHSEFKVIGVQGGCFWTENKLALGTVRGVMVCHLNGKVIKETTLGTVENVKPYNFGFIAVQKNQLMIHSGSDGQLLRTICKRKSDKILKRSHRFKCISDVAVNSRKEIIVLDVGCDTLFVIDEIGLTKKKIQVSSSQFPCEPVKDAYSITIDRHDAVILSDQGNKRILSISSDGLFVKCLFDLNRDVRELSSVGLKIYGVALNHLSELLVALSGPEMSAVLVYSLLK